ncbi:MAG: hypothetical protein SPK22_04855, partial [Alloprevotella sp.]|nr:hypothetical protein [Bacteroidales bacterium]MDY5769525.1 hypothetical protein [Alloprevotella sp.]
RESWEDSVFYAAKLSFFFHHGGSPKVGISSASEVRSGRKGVHTVGGRMPQQCDCEGFGIALPLQMIFNQILCDSFFSFHCSR